MKKAISLIAVLALLLSMATFLSVSSSASPVLEVIYTNTAGDKITLDALNPTAENGKVSFANGVLTLDGSNGALTGKSVRWSMDGSLNVVVKGGVTLQDSYTVLGTSKDDQVCDVTVELVDGATLDLLTTNTWCFTNMNASTTFKGKGTINMRSGMQPCLGLGTTSAKMTGDQTLTFEGDIKVTTYSGTWWSVITNRDGKTNVMIKDNAEVTLTSAKGETWKNLNETHITVQDNAKLVVAALESDPTTCFLFDKSAVNGDAFIHAGEHTKLVAKEGNSAADAKVVDGWTGEDGLMMEMYYLEVQASPSDGEDDPVTTDTSSQPTDTATDTDTSSTVTDTDSASTSDTSTDDPTDTDSTTDTDPETGTDTDTSSTKTDTSSEKPSSTNTDTGSSDASDSNGGLWWIWIPIAAVVAAAVVVAVILVLRKKKS